MTNLATLLVNSAAVHGPHVAVRHDDTTLTYEQLDEASARFAGVLRDRGVRPGDVVTMTMPNVPLFPVVYYGILRAGGVVVPMNPLLKAREAAFVLRDSGARMTLAHPMCAEEVAKAAAETGAACLVTDSDAFHTLLLAAPPLADVVERADDDTALILYTSGTTGTPKGAELTHRNLLTNTATTTQTLLLLGPEDVLFGGLPLFHAFGQTCAMNASVAAGATLTLLPRFDAGRALDVMRRDGVTVFLGVPTMYSALLQARRSDGHDIPAPARGVGRRRPAGRGAARLRADLRSDRAGRLRPVGDLSDGRLQPSGPPAQGRLDRHTRARRRDETRRGDHRGARRDRRDRRPR